MSAWNDWRGDSRGPRTDGKVQVRFRCGRESAQSYTVRQLRWTHTRDPNDIVAWRAAE